MSNYTISKTIELDYGHTLPNHHSFCSEMHGHRAKVVAYVSGFIDRSEEASSEGMVLDFSFLKKVMMEQIHAVLDHGFAVWQHDGEDLEFILKRNKKVLVTEMPPTAECLAEWAYKQIVSEIPGQLHLDKVEWWETPNSCAQYRRC